MYAEDAIIKVGRITSGMEEFCRILDVCRYARICDYQWMINNDYPVSIDQDILGELYAEDASVAAAIPDTVDIADYFKHTPMVSQSFWLIPINFVKRVNESTVSIVFDTECIIFGNEPDIVDMGWIGHDFILGINIPEPCVWHTVEYTDVFEKTRTRSGYAVVSRIDIEGRLICTPTLTDEKLIHELSNIYEDDGELGMLIPHEFHTHLEYMSFDTVEIPDILRMNHRD